MTGFSSSSIARAAWSPLLVERDQLLHACCDEVGIDEDAADSAELEERVEQVVAARVELEADLDDPPRLVEIFVRLLDGLDARDLGELIDRLGLDVDNDARRDVVDDDRQVARRGDRLVVLDDPARRRLVVVRRDDEEAVDAELVAFLVRWIECAVSIRAGARDRRSRGRRLVDGRSQSANFSSSVSVGDSPVVPATTSRRSRCRRGTARARGSASRSTAPSARNGVTIAVRTSPSTV